MEVSSAAGKGGLDYSAGDFRLSGEGIEGSAPIRSQLGDGTLPAGSETHGTLIFQAPEGVESLALSFDGGEPVAPDPGNTEERRAGRAPRAGTVIRSSLSDHPALGLRA